MTDYFGIRIKLEGIAKEPIYSQLFTEKKDRFYLDFDRIAPRPQELIDTDEPPEVVNRTRLFEISSSLFECSLATLIEIYKNPNILKKYKEIDIKSATAAFKKIDKRYGKYSWPESGDSLSETYMNELSYKYDLKREKILNYGMQYIKNTVKYGYPILNNWIGDNWGMDSPTYECTFRNENTLDFNMNWGYPEPIFKKISQMYPDKTVGFEIAEEGSDNPDSINNTAGYCMNGIINYKNGEVIYENLYDKDMQSRIDRYNSIWKDMLGSWGWGKIKKVIDQK